LSALELETGTVKWRKELPGGVLSSVAVKAGLAIFTATDGKVRACDAFTGVEKWSYDAKAPFFAGAAVTKDMVYAADLHGVVHALNLTDGKKEWVLDPGHGPGDQDRRQSLRFTNCASRSPVRGHVPSRRRGRTYAKRGRLHRR